MEKKLKTDWEKVDALTDKQIQAAVDQDADAAPILDDHFWETAKLMRYGNREKVTIRIDQRALNWFKKQGKGYQTRINDVLCAYAESKERSNDDSDR